MKSKSILVLAVVAIVLLSTSPSIAVTITEDFDDGITTGPWGWDVFRTDAADAPWTIEAPDSGGGVRFTKSSDSHLSWESLKVGLESNFLLDGDFSVFVDFELNTFSLTESEGWNQALFMVIVPGVAWFEILRFSNDKTQYLECYSSGSEGPIGLTADTTMEGEFKISREGDTISGWIDRGSGPVPIASKTSTDFVGPMTVTIWANQQADGEFKERPSTTLDVRYDNFSATAETIIPEPATLLLLGLGVIFLRRRRKA